MKWLAPSVVTMKCVFHTTKITVYDVFVRLDIQEHLAVSYIKIWLCDKLSVTSNSVMTKNVVPVSPAVLRVYVVRYRMIDGKTFGCEKRERDIT